MDPVLPRTAPSNAYQHVKSTRQTSICALSALASQLGTCKKSLPKILQLWNCPGNWTVSKKASLNKTLRISKEWARGEKDQEGCHHDPSSNSCLAEPAGVLEKNLLKWAGALCFLYSSSASTCQLVAFYPSRSWALQAWGWVWKDLGIFSSG